MCTSGAPIDMKDVPCQALCIDIQIQRPQLFNVPSSPQRPVVQSLNPSYSSCCSTQVQQQGVFTWESNSSQQFFLSVAARVLGRVDFTCFWAGFGCCLCCVFKRRDVLQLLHRSLSQHKRFADRQSWTAGNGGQKQQLLRMWPLTFRRPLKTRETRLLQQVPAAERSGHVVLMPATKVFLIPSCAHHHDGGSRQNAMTRNRT